MDTVSSRRTQPKSRRIYLSEENMSFVSEVNYPSRVVNMACAHLRHSMDVTLESIHRKFDQHEIDGVIAVFEERLPFGDEKPRVYFSDLEEARALMADINQSIQHLNITGWKSAFNVLVKHGSLDEINCFLYLAKFAEKSRKTLCG